MAKDGKSTRGFASMDPERRREIASLGGRSVPDEKRPFSKDRTLAKKAGSKGGKAGTSLNRYLARTKAEGSTGGRKGGSTPKQ